MGSLGTVVLAALLGAEGGGGVSLDQIDSLIREGRAGDSVRVLESMKAALIEDPESLAKVCAAAATCADDLAATEPAAAPGVTAALDAMTEACLAARPEDPHALRARSYALVAGARLQTELRKEASPDAFLRAADGLEKAHGLDGKTGRDLALAAEFLSEAAGRPGADAAALWQRVEGLAGRVREKHADETVHLATAAHALLARARAMQAAKEKGIEDRLKGVLDFIGEAHGKAPDDLDLCTVHNEVAALVAGLGLKGPKAPFRTRAVDFPIGLRMDVPVSRTWSVPGAGETMVHQFDPGLRSLRTIVVDDNSWRSLIRMGDGSEIGGDNIKGLAGKAFEVGCRQMRKVKSRRAPARGGLKQCDTGWFFEIQGTDGDGDFVRRRVWYFKSKAGYQTTFALSVYDYREGAPDDAALQFVLDSVRERGK